MGNVHGSGAIALALGLLVGTPSAHAGYTVLHSHDPMQGNPRAGLILDRDGNLYGTTAHGGSANLGTVFRVKTDGTGLTVLHSFVGGASDGSAPFASLVLDGDGNLYGTTSFGGSRSPGASLGTVFRMRADGSGFTLLHRFSGGASDGAGPVSSLTLDGEGNLYGTTPSGGAFDVGTVFSLRIDGAGFSLLHSFGDAPGDARVPRASLVLDRSGNLYGTTLQGGGPYQSSGTVFTIRTEGTGFAVLYGFTTGDSPRASLVLDESGNLYGTTWLGGYSGLGSVFTLRIDGSGYKVLHAFAGGKADGASPAAAVLLDAGYLYGTTPQGGAAFDGAAFRMRTDGSEFALLHSFAGGAADGFEPLAPLIGDGRGALYGTASFGGPTAGGVAFGMRTDGSGYRLLTSFAGGAIDGAAPVGLVLDESGTLYGTTGEGGATGTYSPTSYSIGRGTMFSMKKDGSTFTVLHDFGFGEDGVQPSALTRGPDGAFYGTTYAGGPKHGGTVFSAAADGSVTLLHGFEGGPSGAGPETRVSCGDDGRCYGTTTFGGGTGNDSVVFSVRTDGSEYTVLHTIEATNTNGPSSLALDVSGRLFGTTPHLGAQGRGMLFTLKTDGSAFAVLHDFAGGDGDGEWPGGRLLVDRAGRVFGATEWGGLHGYGTVFATRADGSGYQIVRSFDGAADGGSPYLIMADQFANLYGATQQGGAWGHGTLFRLRPDGTGFTVLHSFESGADGFGVSDLAVDARGNLYGTAASGGVWGQGVEFRLAARPGDANGDGVVNVVDAFYLVQYVFSSGPEPQAGGDVNGDGAVDVLDVFHLIRFLFGSGPPPKG